MSNTSFQAPNPEHLAELMPQYDIEGFIAQGGMGAVYKARQRALDRDVAIKILPKELGNSEFRAAFATEAKAMARLNHPNLLGVFDFGEVDGMPYIAMEYVHGQSLYESAHNQVVDPTQAVAIVKEICEGLAHAHGNDIVHRDIKPANILLTLNAKPKIGDFGLAHAADSDQPGLMMGTPGYTAPEVFQDHDLAGTLADIYSVGVILHQLITGIDPSGCLEPPTKLTGNIRLDAIWRKAVNLDPSQRYQSAAAMAADLEKWTTSKASGSLVTGGAPYSPSSRPLTVSSGSSGGSGSVLKWFMIAILAGIAFYMYQLLQEKKEAIHNGSSTTSETRRDALSTPAPIPDKPPVKEPKSKPNEIAAHNQLNETPFIDATPLPDKIATADEPETLPTVALNQKPVSNPELHQDLPPGDPDLLKRAVDLITEARKKRDKKLAENVSKLIRNLEITVRNIKQDEAPSMDQLKKNILTNRIPQVDESTGLPDKIATYFKQALTSESSIDAALNSDLIRIRDAYVSLLKTIAAGSSSTVDLQQRLLAQAERAKDLDAWVNLLSPEPQWTRNSIPSFSSSKGAVGKWINRSYNSESQWIGHPDGRMEIVGHDWEVKWKILEDGTLVVDWNKKAPYTYKLKDDVWVGVNPHGGEATLTRGDW